MVEPDPTPEPEVPADSVPPPEPVPSLAVQTDAVLNAILGKLKPPDEQPKYFKMLIYGPSGHGKTTFMGTAPDNIIIDIEDGLASLANHPDFISDSLQVFPYKSFESLEVVISKFMEQPEELKHLKTMSIDSVSDLHKRGLAETVERDWKRSPTLNNRYVATTEQQMENNERIRRLVSSLRDLPMNLILTAHDRTIEPKNRAAKTFPDFSEKLANTIAGIVDVVVYLSIKEIEGKSVRTLRFHSDGNIAAKTRISGFSEEIINPNWNDIYSIFQKNKKIEE